MFSSYNNVDIEALLSFFDIDYKKSGQSVRFLCPFHNETNPSCFFDLEKGLFHCFGCGASGTVKTFVQRLTKASKEEVERFLRDFDVSPHFLPSSRKESSFSARLLEYERAQKVTEEYYPEYLRKREIFPETCKHFDIRVKLGKVDEVFIPITYNHRITAFVIRLVNDNIDKRYLAAGKTKNYLFNYDTARKFLNVFVVEGPFDALRIFQAGFPNVVATCGVSLGKFQKLFLYGFERLIVVPDNDDAGKAFVDALRQIAFTYVVSLPESVKDIADLPTTVVRDFLMEKFEWTKHALKGER